MYYLLLVGGVFVSFCCSCVFLNGLHVFFPCHRIQNCCLAFCCSSVLRAGCHWSAGAIKVAARNRVIAFCLCACLMYICVAFLCICLCLTITFHRKKVSDASLLVCLLLEVACCVLLGSGLSFYALFVIDVHNGVGVSNDFLAWVVFLLC